MNKRFRLFLTCLASLVIFSCSSIDCPVQNTVSVQYEIRDKAGNALSITDSLTVISERADGKYVSLNSLIGKSAFSLPISYTHPEDVLYFCFKNTAETVIDTVWIKKDEDRKSVV